MLSERKHHPRAERPAAVACLIVFAGRIQIRQSDNVAAIYENLRPFAGFQGEHAAYVYAEIRTGKFILVKIDGFFFGFRFSVDGRDILEFSIQAVTYSRPGQRIHAQHGTQIAADLQQHRKFEVIQDDLGFGLYVAEKRIVEAEFLPRSFLDEIQFGLYGEMVVHAYFRYHAEQGAGPAFGIGGEAFHVFQREIAEVYAASHADAELGENGERAQREEECGEGDFP